MPSNSTPNVLPIAYTPVAALGPAVRVGRAPTEPIDAIVLPEFTGDATRTGRELLSETDALVALIGITLNLRYVGEPGLATLVHLAETVPVHRIIYHSSEQATGLLGESGLS